MPTNARGRSTKEGSGPPSQPHRVEPALTEKYKGHARHELPKHCHKHAGHHQITGGWLAQVLSSTNGSCDICVYGGIWIQNLRLTLVRRSREINEPCLWKLSKTVRKNWNSFIVNTYMCMQYYSLNMLNLHFTDTCHYFHGYPSLCIFAPNLWSVYWRLLTPLCIKS